MPALRVITAVACLPGLLPAQDDGPLEAARAAIRELEEDQAPGEKRLAKLVDAIVAAGPAGLKLLGARLDAADRARDDKRRDRLFTAVGHIAYRWLRKVDKSGMVYAGQYAPLRSLMPQVGQFYLRLLLDTPEWFPITERGKVIPAVRDLYPKGPDQQTVDQIEAMARNELEPEPLRVGLSYALAQWGRRDLVKEKLRALEKAAASDEEGTALLAMRDLAAIHYGIRDYTVAALAHRDFLRRAESADFPLVPESYYNAACCYSLIGDRRTAIRLIEKALQLNNSPRIDSSVRLERDLFEKDPEIAAARQDPRFGKLLDEAFGDDKEPAPPPRKRGATDGGDQRKVAR